MAQLKDTIINGDLTVTGNIVGESIQADVAAADGSILGTVKGGGGVTISKGTITVVDDGHNHTKISQKDANNNTITFGVEDANEINVTTTDSTATVLYFNYATSNFKTIAFCNGTNSTTAAAVVEAGTFNAKSDKRLKENLSLYKNEKSILDLPVYKFDFKDGLKNQIGCMAQDLQEICPEIVSEGGDGYLSIQESKIVYLLLQEVKQLRKELDELKR